MMATDKPRYKRYVARALDGVLVLDKPTDISSNQALQQVRHLFQAKKAGHGGTLDPLATGLLLICFGRATRLLRFMLDADKAYQVVAQLGANTDTGDAQGAMTATYPVKVDETDIKKALKHFEGESLQVPPMYSALKHQGVPLHKLARQGETINRKARKITIHANHFLQYDSELKQLSFDVGCSKGTYVRTLVEDMGQRLGCGAHVKALRRTVSGAFKSSQMLMLDDLLAQRGNLAALDAFLLPTEHLVAHLPAVELPTKTLRDLRCGRACGALDLPEEGAWVRLYDEEECFVGVGQCHWEGRPLSSIVWLSDF